MSQPVCPARARLGRTSLQVFPLAFGGNVIGWTVDRAAAFGVLDAYFEAGGNFIDTADEYSCWVDGHDGGESEQIIGEWMRSRGNRDQLVIASKVGRRSGHDGLAPGNIGRAIDGTLQRLGTDHVDLYYAHLDDPETPQEEAVTAFARVVAAGKARFLGASSFTAERLESAAVLAQGAGLPRYDVIQPLYNAIQRDEYEGPLAAVCTSLGIACTPHSTLAQGFLTGKYAPARDPGRSPRRRMVERRYMNERGFSVLRSIEDVAETRGEAPATIALAWLLARENVVAPIASATSPEQLQPLLAAPSVALSEEESALIAGAYEVEA